MNDNEVLDLLNKIEKNTRMKNQLTLEFKMTSNKEKIFFDEPISHHSGKYQMGVASFSAWNTVFNITSANNNFRYSNYTLWRDIRIAPGAYQISQINEAIHRQLDWNGDLFNQPSEEFPIELYADKATQKSVVEFKVGPGVTFRYKVDFKPINSIGKLLGFTERIIDHDSGINMSDNKVDIIAIDKVHLHCNVIRGSILNGKNSDILYSFHLDKPPGFQIFYKESFIQFKTVTTDKLESIYFEFRDDDGKPVSFQGETITFTLILIEK